jgi:16S rRNA (uracil1498-N3)-methyltransferase
MRLHRFFVTEEIGKSKEVTLRDSGLHHQLKNVFRFTTGGQVVILDNTGYEYHALISAFGYGEVTFSIVKRAVSKNLPSKELILLCSLPKKDKFEWILEKGTEIGVMHFVPIVSDRSEKKDLNIERCEKILKESAEQSGRAMIPTLSGIQTLEEVLDREVKGYPCIVFDPKGEMFVPEHVHSMTSVGAFIGPEGGWTERELYLFKKNKIKSYSLGGMTLRAETAAIVVSTLVLLT